MSMSPHSAIPVVTVTFTPGVGHMVLCKTCGWEYLAPRRPAADRVRHEHMQAHAKKKGG